MVLSAFKQKLLFVPNQPGCYLFKNQENHIIYVGKAQNLKKRIVSYFSCSTHEKISYLQTKINDFDIIITANIKEALILEQNLIKKYQPCFNVLLRDDNYYPYLKITNEQNPRYKIVRKTDLNKKGEYFGPFPDGSQAHKILQLLERLFPLAKCKGDLKKPCFYYTIGQCSGHCWQKVDSSSYERTKKEVKKFFQGKTQEIKAKIKKSIQKNIANLAFEIAQKEKKILDNIDFFASQQNVEFTEQQNCDFLGIYLKENVISFCLLIYRYGKLVAKNEVTFSIWTSQEEVLESYLYQFYQKNLSPQILYIPEKLVRKKILEESFGFSLKIPLQGKKKKILGLAHENARQVWQRSYWNEFQQINKSKILEEIGVFLSIPIPNYIECLDISNLYKQDAVAGFLVFINGERNLAKSKLYKLEKTKQNSDISRIKEACLIHYRNYLPEKMPELIIVDGGKEQAKAVQHSLQKLKLQTKIIGLVKNEKHQTSKVITKDLKELNFEKNERIKNFFTNCQEAVHHYAINFHRKLHRRNVLQNNNSS